MTQLNMKDIPGYEGSYMISEIGEVYSVPRFKVKGGFVKPRVNQDGYPCVYLSSNNKVKTKKIHRLVAEIFVFNPNPEEFKVVNHIDGNKLNYHPSNLEWCTVKHNVRHSWETGLSKALRGEANGGSKLSNKERIEVVKLYALSNLTQHEIASKYRITQSNVATLIKAYLKNHFDAGLAVDIKTITP